VTYTVLGTGAVGGYYGAKLQKYGKTVRFIARSDYDTIKNNGLTIKSINGNFKLSEVEVYKSEDTIPFSDVILIAIKTTSNKYLKNILTPIVKDRTIIIVLQNGIGMEEELSKYFPTATIMGGLCFICSQKTAPAEISHFDVGHIFAAPMKIENKEILETISNDFNEAGIKFEVYENLVEQRWKKLLWNIPFNSLSVILNADTGEIVKNSKGISIVKKLMVEVQKGAKSQGCELSDKVVESMINATVNMKPYLPSMRVDYDNNRKIEIEYMFRKPIEIARINGIELPFTEFIADQLEFLEQNH